MADVERTLERLDVTRAVLLNFNYPAKAEDVAAAIALIESQAAELKEKDAEIERLTPKPMTLEDVARVLNERKHSGFTRWTPEPFYYAVDGETLFRAENGSWTLREFEARAIVEKYEREQEAARA